LDDASGLGHFAVDHVAICLTPDEFYQVVGRYLSAFKLDVIHEEIVSTETMAMNSVALADSRRETKFVFVEPRQGKHKSQIQGFIDRFGGSGVHHVAFSVSNITNFVFRLQERHVEFFQVPSNYYVEVGNRIGAIDGDLRLLQQANVLVDRDSDGLLYQTFTKPIF
jgi:4-hydroxyphenylpyruvate dioxygenase